jgi:GTP-binding protein
MDTELVISAGKPDQFPADTLPEVAFLGRSNVGKSSLLNCLTGKNKNGVAFTSATPGRTQSINFYRVDGRFHFVDLPGYGYAKVPLPIKVEWKGLIESYLLNRKALELCVLILDSRRGWTEKDLELRDWLEFHERRYAVVATKMDKLKSQTDQYHGMKALRSHCSGDLLPFSAVECRGVREIWQAIWKIQNKQ